MVAADHGWKTIMIDFPKTGTVPLETFQLQ